MFNASVTRLANSNNRRAGRSSSTLAPFSARWRDAISRARTDRSMAGATSGATHPDTPSRSPRLSTLPNPNMNVSPTTTPMITVTASGVRSTPAEDRPGYSATASEGADAVTPVRCATTALHP